MPPSVAFDFRWVLGMELSVSSVSVAPPSHFCDEDLERMSVRRQVALVRLFGHCSAHPDALITEVATVGFICLFVKFGIPSPGRSMG